MNLDDLLNEMSEKMRNRDLSDEYLREHNNSTREEIGIGEYAYGITMIPCKWVYEYLSDYKSLQKENEELKGTLRDTQNSWFEDTKKMEKLKNQNQCYINSIQSIAPVLIQEYIEKQEIKDKIGDLADTANKINDEIVEELKSKDICQEYLEDKRKELGLINRDIKTLQSLLDESEEK